MFSTRGNCCLIDYRLTVSNGIVFVGISVPQIMILTQHKEIERESESQLEVNEAVAELSLKHSSLLLLALPFVFHN